MSKNFVSRIQNFSSKKKKNKNQKQTRRYPWGIQRLVSTHPNCNILFSGVGGGVFLDSQNSKCQVLANFLFSGVGGGVFLGSQNSWQNEPNILEAKFHCSCLDHPRSIFTNRALFSTQHQIFFSFNCDNKRYQSRAALIMLMFRLFLLHPCNIHTGPESTRHYITFITRNTLSSKFSFDDSTIPDQERMESAA